MDATPHLLVAPSVAADFLSLIAISEGTSTSSVTQNRGYDVIVWGVNGQETFSDYTHHPFAAGRRPELIHRGPPPLYSTASGRYQFLLSTWLGYAHRLNLRDFAPASQDRAALQQVVDCGGMAPLLAGDIPLAISKCSGIWASLPGNNYHQGAHPVSWLIGQWDALQLRST